MENPHGKSPFLSFFIPGNPLKTYDPQIPNGITPMENPRLWPSQGVKDFLDILCGPEKKAPAEAGDMSRGSPGAPQNGEELGGDHGFYWWFDGISWDLLMIWWDLMVICDMMGGTDEYLIAKAAIC